MIRLLILAQLTGLDLKRFQFHQQPGDLTNQIPFFIMLGFVLVGVVVAAMFYLRHRRRMLEMTAQREEARFRLLATELNLDDAELKMLQLLVGSEELADVVPLLESRAEFETSVSRFRAEHPHHPLLRRTPMLRQRLNYGFNNIRNPFVDTHMLAPGIKLRCRLRLPKRDVQFLTTVMALNEERFSIQPPTAKGKPVSLGHLKELTFRVSRENDAEYEFSAPVLGQTPNEVKAVMLEHTRRISRLLFRNAERIPVSIEAPFYVIRHEYTTDKSGTQHRSQDSQYMFQGTLRDLSISGALVLAESLPHLLHDGDMVIFRLTDAQIKDDMAGLVVGALPQEKQQAQVHLQFVGMKEINRLKLTKYLSSLRQPQPAEEREAAPPAPAAR